MTKEENINKPEYKEMTAEQEDKLQEKLYHKAIETGQNLNKKPHPNFDGIPNKKCINLEGNKCNYFNDIMTEEQIFKECNEECEGYNKEIEEEELTTVDKVENKKNRKTKRVTKKAFFQSGLFGFKLGKKKPVDTLISPVLFLERDGMSTQVIEDVEPGIFPLREKAKGIICSPLKLKKMEYNGEYIDYWYANENQAVAGFPDPIMDAEIIYQTTKKTVLNYEEFDKEAGSFKLEQLKLIGIILGIAILAIWLIWSGMAERILAKFGLVDLVKDTATGLGNTASGATGKTTVEGAKQVTTEIANILFLLPLRRLRKWLK